MKAAMQAVADSTALMLSKEVSKLTSSQMQTKANDYFKAVFNRPEAEALKIVATYTSQDGYKLKIDATANVKTDFMQLMGFSKVKVGADSQVAWGNTKLRVALALDVTGSMKDKGKMPAMQTAAKALINQLKDAAMQNGDVYMSIIPFNKDVAWNPSNYNSSWLRWDIYNENTGSCSKSPWKGSYDTKSECEDNGGKWSAENKSKWNGCITDRDQNYDTTNTAPGSNSATKFPAENYSSCPAPMIGLSYDWNALTNKIDELTPVGMTNQGIGLQWAFQSLTASPFSIPKKDKNFKYTEVIILMTDGLNTQNRWYNKQADIDARQDITCANAKAKDIIIYTIQVNTDGDPTQSVLQKCASTPDKFFLLTSANQMVSTFQQIGTALSNLRIAK